eukprot:CAMPEP_0114226028 /NCGR_PEP_ID=MMETSP0058-20121206/1010_1 /TAXON_ID=36894 /ORGANISM="Pyramimonas parkeae, CCMP726" /LENGTH=87 /DNA_ID=CAMNT_0001336719 /DNA_START=281 /DNA_END=544 /DNA_ORIENTATION=-
MNRTNSTSRALTPARCASENKSGKPSITKQAKKMMVDQMRAGARRPVEAADSLQNFQQQRPELVTALFALLSVLAAASVVDDLLRHS